MPEMESATLAIEGRPLTTSSKSDHQSAGQNKGEEIQVGEQKANYFLFYSSTVVNMKLFKNKIKMTLKTYSTRLRSAAHWIFTVGTTGSNNKQTRFASSLKSGMQPSLGIKPFRLRNSLLTLSCRPAPTVS